MHTADEHLSPSDAAIVAAVVAGRSTTEAAADAGVSVSTAYRRLRDPQVRRAVADARAERLRPLAEATLNHARGSIDRLVRLRDDPTSHPSTVARVCEILIGTALKLHDAVDVQQRVAALEAAGTGEPE